MYGPIFIKMNATQHLQSLSSPLPHLKEEQSTRKRPRNIDRS